MRGIEVKKRMDEKLMVALADLLPRDEEKDQWIILHVDSNKVLDVLSNMRDLEKRRQLLAKIDQMWADIIESEKRKPKKPDRDAFKTDKPKRI